MSRKIATHVALSDADRAAIEALPFTTRIFEPGSYLVREGDTPAQCAVLLSGFAFRQKLTGEGARQIVALHIPGEILDLANLYLDTSDHNVQTLTRTELALIPRAALREVAEANAGVAHGLMVGILVEAAIQREWLLNIGRRDARSRLAHLLCEFAVRLDAQGIAAKDGYELPMTQEQLADALGLTPVHVNRTLRALEQDGVLTRKGRMVRFPRWEALRDVADFSSRYLHLAQQDGRLPGGGSQRG